MVVGGGTGAQALIIIDYHQYHAPFEWGLSRQSLE